MENVFACDGLVTHFSRQNFCNPIFFLTLNPDHEMPKYETRNIFYGITWEVNMK